MRVVMTARTAQPVTVAARSGGRVTAEVGMAHMATRYPSLTEKPSIEGTVLVGDRKLEEIGVGTLTPQDIDRLLYG